MMAQKSSREVGDKQEEEVRKSPFFYWQGVSIYRQEPLWRVVVVHFVRALAAGFCDWFAWIDSCHIKAKKKD